MKQLTITIVLLVSYLAGYAQGDLPYKHLSAFGTDTVAFMTYNFKDRAGCYIGKTVNDVLTDLNSVSIKSYTYGFEKNRKNK